MAAAVAAAATASASPLDGHIRGDASDDRRQLAAATAGCRRRVAVELRDDEQLDRSNVLHVEGAAAARHLLREHACRER